MKQVFEIPKGCNRVAIEQLGNKIITTFEPEFKDGDVIFTRWEDHNAICILKGAYNGDAARLYYYASLSSQSGSREDSYVGILSKRFDRSATESETKQLFEAMAKKSKQWNAEKKCIEDLKPKRWRADKGCNYFYINSCGLIVGSLDYYLPDENKIYHFGNYFQTEQQAEAAAGKINELLKQINP